MRVKSSRTKKTFYGIDWTGLKNSWERRTVVECATVQNVTERSSEKR